MAKLRPDADDILRIHQAREAIRHEVGSGGQCHEVADWVAQEFGWPRHSGSYTDPADDTICDAHVWNVLPDGAILDGTADQFGEGHDVRVVEPDVPDFHRYRDEWYQDFYPGHPDCPEIANRAWSGEFDGERMNRLRQERGDAWWLTERTALDEYQARPYEQYGAASGFQR